MVFAKAKPPSVSIQLQHISHWKCKQRLCGPGDVSTLSENDQLKTEIGMKNRSIETFRNIANSLILFATHVEAPLLNLDLLLPPKYSYIHRNKHEKANGNVGQVQNYLIQLEH